MTIDTSRHRARVGAAILFVALAAGGCTHAAKGGGTATKGATAGGATAVGAEANNGPPNGLEAKTAAEVQRAAAATLKNAKSVHVTVTGPNQPLRLDLRIQGNATTGTIGMGTVSYQVTSIGGDTWIKGDQRALRALGISAAVGSRVAGHWFKAPGRQASGMAGFSLDSLAGGVGRNDTPLKSKVGTATLDGRKVLVVSQRNGAKLYVAATGPAFPLRTDEKAPGSGQVRFSEFGVDFRINAPADVVDLNAAG
jgi:hypothetical protein